MIKKAVAIALCLVMTAGTFALAGPRGSGRSGSSIFKSRTSPPPASSVRPTEAPGKTGTIKDLGVNPSTRSPIDSVKTPQTTGGPAAPVGATPAPAAPSSSFFGGGGFGSSWMTWGILGYLLGRQHHPTTTQKVEEIELVPAD